MKDRYRHWNESSPSVEEMTARILRAPKNLEDLVLHDLDKAETESEKLEILDSYSLASQRQYRNEMHQGIADIGQRFFAKLIGHVLEVALPQPGLPYHSSRAVRPVPRE